MAQITGGMSWVASKVEVSSDGSAWTDISGAENLVAVGGGDRATGEIHTSDGDTPILTGGKRGSLEVSVNIVYTEGATDPFEVYRARYEGNLPLYFRWSPAGGNEDDFQFTTDPGICISHPYPAGNANSGDPLVFTAKIKTAKIAQSAVPAP